MKTTSLMAGASRFAHFAGLTRSGTRAEGDDPEDKKDEKRSGKAEGDDPEGDDEKKDGKRSGKAEGDDPEGDDEKKDGKRSGKAESDDPDDDDEKKDGKRSRRAEDEDDDGNDAEDDDEDEMKGKSATAQARRREQARIAHILGHKAAANNPVLAVSLACDTRMTRCEAVALLKAQPAGQTDTGTGGRHSRRDRQDRNVPLGSEASQPTGKQAVKSSWDAAWKKAGVTAR